MFGIIHTVLAAFGAIGSKIEEICIDAKNKKERVSTTYGHPMWLDQKGRWRDIKTDKHLYIDPKNKLYGDNHLYIYEADSGKIIKDVTQDKIDKAEKESKKEALAKRETVYRLGTVHDAHRYDPCKGYRYKDTETGDIYVKRYFNSIGRLLLRVSDGMLIRLDDGFDNTETDRKKSAENEKRKSEWEKNKEKIEKMIHENGENDETDRLIKNHIFLYGSFDHYSSEGYETTEEFIKRMNEEQKKREQIDYYNRFC